MTGAINKAEAKVELRRKQKVRSDSDGEARDARLEALLADATEVFNQNGVSAARISEITKGVGLNRASIYYYVGSREELIYRTYMRTCVSIHARYEQALAERGSGLERLSSAVRRHLEPASQSLALLTEVAALSPIHRNKLSDMQDRSLAILTAMVRDGMADGSISPHFEPELVAVLIEGALGWLPMWQLPGRTNIQENNPDEFVAFLANGRAPRDKAFQSAFPFPKLSLATPGNAAFDREMQRDQKKDALVRAATMLFNRFGSEGASLNDIVDQLGVTKGTFYHYFSDKDELLFECQERSLGLVAEYMALADQEGSNGLEKIQLCGRHNFAIRYGPTGPLALFAGFRTLPDDRRRVLMEETNANSRRMQNFTRTGQRDGSIRENLEPSSTNVTAGALNWLPLRPEIIERHGIALTEFNFMILFTNGLAPRK